MSLDNLPVEWLLTSIENISEVIAGGTPKANDPENFVEPPNGIGWLTPADLSGYSHKYIGHGKRDLSEKGYKSSSAKLIPKGSVVFSSRAPIGYVAIASNEISTNQGFKNFVIDENISSEYLYYYLKRIRDLAESLGTGTTFKELSGSACKKLPFVLAPLVEQQEIVRQLDVMLAQVEQIKARLDAIPAILKKFRQSLLEDSFNDLEIIDDLENLVQPKRSISYGVLKPGDYCNDGIVLLRIKDILSNIDLESDDLHKIPQDLSEQYKRTILHGKETLISLVGTVGRIGYVSDNLKGANVHRNLGVIAPNQDKIDSKFLNYQMQSEFIQSQIRHVTTGANQPLLNLGDVRKLNIRLTDIDSQEQIVEKIKLNIGLIAKIDDQLKSAQRRVNLLTQSILAKAFNGELTAEWREQHQDLITGVNSAEALLAKIQAEREASKPVKKAKKVK